VYDASVAIHFVAALLGFRVTFSYPVIHLFGVVNALLAAASLAVAAVVILYRPIDIGLVVIATVAATVLAAVLIAASVFTTERDGPADVSTG
jgi:hypothetical protein